MLHAGLDLSRKRLDARLLSEHGELVEEFSATFDGDGLRGLVRHVERHGVPVRAVIESMTRALRSRYAGAAWLGGSDRRRAES